MEVRRYEGMRVWGGGGWRKYKTWPHNLLDLLTFGLAHLPIN